MFYRLICFLFAILAFCGLAPLPAAAETITVENAVYSTVDYYKNNKPQLSHWEEIVALEEACKALGKADKLDEFDVSGWEPTFDNNSQATDYAGAILGKHAIGEDTDELAETLIGMQQDDGGFGGTINNTIYAMMALDKIGANYGKTAAITYLISQKKADGGFALSGSSGDPDLTGMALVVLSNHRDIDGVNKAIEEAIGFLREKQLDSGGFGSGGDEYAESTAAVIRGLLACGKDIVEDIDDWIKAENSVVKALFRFRLDDGSFSHRLNGSSDETATRQALLALAALVDKGHGDIPVEIDAVKVRVECYEKTLQSGTVTTNGTALDALKALVGEEEVVENGGFVTAILDESPKETKNPDISTSWKYYVIRDGAVDSGAFSSGPGSYSVEDGDEVVFYIGAYDNTTSADKTYRPVVEVSPLQPAVGQSVTVSVYGEYFDFDIKDFKEVAVDGVTVDFDGRQYITEDGQVTIPLTEAGTFTYQVYKQHADGYPELVRSDFQLVVKPLDSDAVKVRVVGNESILKSGTVTVTGTALDALKALVGEEEVVENGGFVTAILDESPKETKNPDISIYWMYYVVRDGAVDPISLSLGSGDYNVEAGDEVVFYICAFGKTYLPVVEVSPPQPAVGQSVTVSVYGEYYDFDIKDFKEVPVDGVTVDFDGRQYTTENGQVTIPLTEAGTFTYQVYKQHADGYPELVRSDFQLVVKPQQGGGVIDNDTVTVSVKVLGKERNVIYTGDVELAADEADAFHALAATGLSYRAKWDNAYVYEIDGIKEDLSGTAGWKYKVNGYIPGISAKDYKLSSGDDVVWFWAVDAFDTGEGDITPALEDPELPVLSDERAADVERSREAAEKELKKMAEKAMTLPDDELYNTVEIINVKPTVIAGDSTMQPEEIEQWKKILQQNTVDVKQEVAVGEAAVLGDAAEEVELSIPADALTKAAAISIKEDSFTGVTPSTHRLVTPVYRCTPDGLIFAKPVTLKIKLVEDVSPENLVLAWYNTNTKSWVPVPTVVNTSAGEVSGLINHFTDFAVLERTAEPAQFTDVHNAEYQWAEKPIQYLALKGIVAGVGDGKFAPDRQVTRAEFVTMMVKALELSDAAEELQFSDVDEDFWGVNEIKAAVKAGLIKGYDDGTFRPNAPVTREQTAAFLTRAVQLNAADSEPLLKDGEEISLWARKAVSAAVANQLIDAYEDGSFCPQKPATRAETAVSVYRLLKLNTLTD